MRVKLHPSERLVQVLEGQRTIYAALLALYKDNSKAIAEWDLVSLKPLLSEEQRLLKELNFWEQRRHSTMSRLCSEWQYSGTANPTLRQLLSYAEEHPECDLTAGQRDKLTALATAISTMMQEVTELRAPLLPLLQAALSFLERNDNSAQAQKAYSSTGKAETRAQQPNPHLDRKV